MGNLTLRPSSVFMCSGVLPHLNYTNRQALGLSQLLIIDVSVLLLLLQSKFSKQINVKAMSFKCFLWICLRSSAIPLVTLSVDVTTNNGLPLRDWAPAKNTLSFVISVLFYCL